MVKAIREFFKKEESEVIEGGYVLPTFITEFCLPDDIYEREYSDEDAINWRNILRRDISKLLEYSRGEHNEYFNFTCTFSHDIMFSFHDIKVFLGGRSTTPRLHFHFNGKDLCTMEKDGETGFVWNGPHIEFKNVGLYVCEYLVNVIEDMHEKEREQIERGLEHLKCSDDIVYGSRNREVNSVNKNMERLLQFQEEFNKHPTVEYHLVAWHQEVLAWAVHELKKSHGEQ